MDPPCGSCIKIMRKTISCIIILHQKSHEVVTVSELSCTQHISLLQLVTTSEQMVTASEFSDFFATIASARMARRESGERTNGRNGHTVGNSGKLSRPCWNWGAQDAECKTLDRST